MGSREQTWKTKLVCQGVTARMTGKQRALPSGSGVRRVSPTLQRWVLEKTSHHTDWRIKRPGFINTKGISTLTSFSSS